MNVLKHVEVCDTHTHTHTCITKKILTKGGYKCSFLNERWCHALDCRHGGWL